MRLSCVTESFSPPTKSFENEQTVTELEPDAGDLDIRSLGSAIRYSALTARGGRELVAAYVASATQGSTVAAPWRCLWVQGGRAELDIHPPALRARGVDLGRFFLTTSPEPVRQLKPIFLDPVFKLIVIDAPEKLSDGDLVFIAQKARAHRQIILLLRPHFLTDGRGNVWAKVRVNAWQQEASPGTFRLESIRGLVQRSVIVNLRPSSTS